MQKAGIYRQHSRQARFHHVLAFSSFFFLDVPFSSTIFLPLDSSSPWLSTIFLDFFFFVTQGSQVIIKADDRIRCWRGAAHTHNNTTASPKGESGVIVLGTTTYLSPSVTSFACAHVFSNNFSPGRCFIVQHFYSEFA